MTWEAIKPHLGTFLTAILSIALGVGGTVGVQAVRAPEAPKSAPAVETKVVCVSPDSASKMLERVTGVETVGTLILDEMRLARNELERRERAAIARAAAEKKAAQDKGSVMGLFK